MGDHQNGLSREGPTGPQFEQLAAERLGTEDIQGGKRLVETEEFRFNSQGTGKPDFLTHTSG
jgi:hypothetical protein